VILVGNCTREIEIKHTGGGTAIAEIGLAVNDRVKKNNEWIDEVTFVDCTAFGRTAEVAGEYLKKGSPTLIEGRLKLETWQTNDGQNRSKLKVIVDRLQLLGSKSDSNPRPDSRPANGSDRGNPEKPAYDDDIPF
jgi:single-strand DNA-binding protein